MVTVRQYYEARGAPMSTPSAPGDVVAAWFTHRDRLRGWLSDLPEASWSNPTRCEGWCVADLAQHLISGSQFLGYTLHQARKGEATRLLANFDPTNTPGAAASQFGQLGPQELLAALGDVDASVRREAAAFTDTDWRAPAEAPPGRVPAWVSVNHFLFDSWVHERDLMLPAGQDSPVVSSEVAIVLSYVLALAGIAQANSDDSTMPQVTFGITTTDTPVRLRVERDADGTRVTRDDAPDSPTIAGTAGGLVDYATGRDVQQDGPPEVCKFLRNLADLLA